MLNKFIKYIIILICIIFNEFLSTKCAMSFMNVNNTMTQSSSIRSKRWIIFQNGGVAKMAFGAIFPLYLEDKVKWRQVNCGYNLQAQFSVPTSPLYVWDRWQGRTLKSVKQKFDKYGTYYPDESRKFVYLTLELFMHRRGKNGRKCLLRSICENAEIDHHEGIFAEILNAILTPGIDNLKDEYGQAYQAGKHGADCLKLFPECSKGEGLLDLVDVTFNSWT